MKKSNKMVWRVVIADENYTSTDTFLMLGRDASAVEKRGIAKVKEGDKYLEKNERKHKPYVRSIERVGELTE